MSAGGSDEPQEAFQMKTAEVASTGAVAITTVVANKRSGQQELVSYGKYSTWLASAG